MNEKHLIPEFRNLDREIGADAGIRTRVLTLARSSDNQLHYVHLVFPRLYFLI